MKNLNHNLYLTLEFLSNKELYYSSLINNNQIIIADEDFKHAAKVMRHVVGDQLFVTDGTGNIYETIITEIKKDCILSDIGQQYSFKNKYKNLFFCIPKLKSPERFEFALEKCTELGITNFIIFNADHSVAKGDKIERWQKIVLAAMKQSLNCYLPQIIPINRLNNLSEGGIKVIFEQNSNNSFLDFSNIEGNDYYFIFGPEGGLSKKEIEIFDNSVIYNLAENRLRAETAIIKTASMLK
ncbi:MAG: RsmE family RNA methyltransferase [Bacteroidota bacterium]|nr:RsmE family RNA methyltransferase [Bacteroidota bacterium]